MPKPQDVVDESLKLLKSDPLLVDLKPAAWERLRQVIVQAVASENEACMINLWNAAEGDERDAMVNRFAEIEHLLQSSGTQSMPSHCLDTTFWTRWYPGLDNDHLTVGSVLDTMPGFNNEDIPAIIRAFESPDSPLKLPGACTLEQHDVLHVLLGRGLVDQDEAFVLGFTAVADPEFSNEDMDRYKFAFSIYPEPYCIRGCDLIAFDLGVEAARKMKLQSLIDLDTENVRNQPVGQVRRELGIDKDILLDSYQEELQRIPTPWSKRLPKRLT
jgi:hypothetical protein